MTGGPGSERAPAEADSGFFARINAVASLYESRKTAAVAAGVSTDQLQRYLRGENHPTFGAAARLADGVGVSLEWLAHGHGPMKLEDRQQPRSATSLDPVVLEEAVNMADEFLRSRRLEIAPGARWKLYRALYEVGIAVGQGNMSADKFENVIRLVVREK